MEDKYFTKYVDPDGTVTFRPINIRAEDLVYEEPEVVNPVRDSSPIFSKSFPLVTRNSPVFEEKPASPRMRNSPLSSNSPRFSNSLLSSSSPRFSNSPLSSNSPRSSLRPQNSRSPASNLVSQSPSKSILSTEEEISMGGDTISLITPNTKISYVPNSDEVDTNNVITFYADLVRDNIIGILVQDFDDANNLLEALDATERGRYTPRLIHYLQLTIPEQVEEATYWGSGSPIIKISPERPTEGKIEYIVAVKDARFFAIVILQK